MAFQSTHWKGVLISEVLLAIGTVSMYAVFILLISFWANMLHKVEQSESSPDNIYNASRKPRGPLETFSMVMVALLVMEGINVGLFLCRVYNAEVMILYDSALFSVVSLSCLYGISFFSSRIRIILQTLGYINAKSTKQQVQRILAITLAANVFFLLRVIIEVCIGITLILHFISSPNFFFQSHTLWSKFILSKHWLEVFILALELIVSTSVSSHAHGTRQQSHKAKTGSESKRRNNKPRQSLSSEDTYLPTTTPAATSSSSSSAHSSRGHTTSTPSKNTSGNKASSSSSSSGSGSGSGGGGSNTKLPPTENTPLLKKKIIGTRYSL